MRRGRERERGLKSVWKRGKKGNRKKGMDKGMREGLKICWNRS